MLILGIETSCDETSAAIVRDGATILSNIVASQAALHEQHRGQGVVHHREDVRGSGLAGDRRRIVANHAHLLEGDAARALAPESSSKILFAKVLFNGSASCGIPFNSLVIKFA